MIGISFKDDGNSKNNVVRGENQKKYFLNFYEIVFEWYETTLTEIASQGQASNSINLFCSRKFKWALKNLELYFKYKY